ncbi:hypothetical protein CCACVL1_00141 [Corchorus capsularis]|uniref:Uncharacterized protein n=1 Tax=Corchorus capsularis TaxID=210143 RepID=A0A1R3KYB2_COCAP|nr:hypothetical protein CCACVL1_00141 [Corchorus capsularis]
MAKQLCMRTLLHTVNIIAIALALLLLIMSIMTPLGALAKGPMPPIGCDPQPRRHLLKLPCPRPPP